MAQHAVIVRLPEEIYERVKRTARGMKQPVEQTLVRIVEAAIPSLEQVPSEYHQDMESLGDEELGRMAQTSVPATQQRQLTRPLRKNERGPLTERDPQQFAQDERDQGERPEWIIDGTELRRQRRIPSTFFECVRLSFQRLATLRDCGS